MARLRTKFTEGRGYTKEDWDAVDFPEMTDEELAQMRPAREVLPPEFFTGLDELRRSRGRPRIESPKEAVTLRLDSETIQKFKSKGADWRARMAEALDKAAS